MTFCITGVGTAVPHELITQEDAARLAIELAGESYCHGPAIRTLYQKTGVRKRNSVLITSSTNGQPATQSFFPVAVDAGDRGPTTGDRMRHYETDALELAASAARDALCNSETSPREISHLVTVSCTGFNAPGVDVGLIERLGLRREVSRTHLGFMGCHGALNGLRVAASFGNSAATSKVLLCCVELCSIHHQYAADSQQIVANALFSDGAAALVGTSARQDHATWRLQDQCSQLLPDTTDLMAWRIGDHGFEMRLSPRVPETIRQTLRPWLDQWLARRSLKLSDVKSWAVHPGGPRILAACQQALNLDDSQLAASWGVLANHGNMSSPTILFIVDQLRQRGENLPCVALAFGPGLTIEGALFY